MIPILLALAAVQTTPSAAPQPDSAAETRFRGCTELARTDPRQAADNATVWAAQGGGFLARQCLGLAYVQLEMWASAATAFEQAAQEAGQDARRVDLLVQAGNAWLAVDEADNALRNFEAALATGQLSDAMRGEVHLDRARARVSRDDAAGARSDVDQALALVPGDAFAWYMSAALARRENALDRARTDIARALQLAPDNPDIMLLGGTLAGLSGNMAEAERLYRRVVETAPDTPAGRAAAASLATVREVEVPASSAAPATTPATPPPASPQAPPPEPQLR